MHSKNKLPGKKLLILVEGGQSGIFSYLLDITYKHVWEDAKKNGESLRKSHCFADDVQELPNSSPNQKL